MTSIDRTVLAPSSISAASTLGTAVQAGTRDHVTRVGLHAWAVAALLFLVPLFAYWPTTFHDFGLRDDYSNLREAREEPGVVLKFCASHARPIYGLLLRATYGETSSVQNLRWMRLGATLLLGALSLVLFRSLRAFGWPDDASLCFALLLGLVPSAQVIASWAVGWPYAATALIAVGAYFAADGAMAPGISRARAAAQWTVALGLMVTAALIYQPSAMFYVVPVTAAFIAQRERALADRARSVAIHVGFVLFALGFAYFIMSALYAAGVFVKSGRIAFEQHWGTKIGWFLGEMLPNALSLFVLNDNNQRDHALYVGCAGLVGLVLIAGCVLEWRRGGRARGLAWSAALCGMPLLACAVSLVASERYATYRTIFAMTAVLLLFLVASVKWLVAELDATARRALVGAVLLTALFTAQHHAYALIAVPQGNEWQLILDGAKRVPLPRHPVSGRPRVFAIASSPADLSTATIYHDEFGSLSSNSEWVPREMFKRAMHDVHPEIPNVDTRYEFATGAKLPPGQRFDVVIDLHRLRRFYTEN